MSPFTVLGIGLSFLFCCFLLGLLAKPCYILWWKSRIASRDTEDKVIGYAPKTTFNIFSFRTLDSFCNYSRQEITNQGVMPKGFLAEETMMESGLLRLQSLWGPPRFLFTIKEETMEDLESDDEKSRGDGSRKEFRRTALGSLALDVDTRSLAPLSAPPSLKAQHLSSYSHQQLNPLFELSVEAELKVGSLPPSKFKFLRDAEEKLLRRLLEQAGKRALKNVQDEPSVKATPDSTVCAVEESKEEFHHQPSSQ